MPPNWSQVEAAFFRALELPADERARFLETTYASDPRLRSRVLKLLEIDLRLPAWEDDDGRANLEAAGYRLHTRIGSGAFGEVWIAQDSTLTHWCAVKLVPAHRSTELEGLQRLKREVAPHPNLVPIEHARIVANRLFCVMPLADSAGGSTGPMSPGDYVPLTLDRAMRRGAFRPREVALLGADLADALEHLHASGVLHGDVKPANILSLAGRWCLADYGLAMNIDRPRVAGFTPQYVPREGAGSRSADQFALGITLQLLLEGADESSPIMSDRSEQALIRRLRAVLARMTGDTAAARYPSMRAASEALRRTVRAPRLRMAALAVPAALALALTPVLLPGRPEPLAVRGFEAVIHRDDSGGVPRPVGSIHDPDTHARPGDHLKINAEVAGAAYCTVLFLDAAGVMSGNPPLPLEGAGRAVSLTVPPRPGDYIPLQAGPGCYAVLLVLSDQPLPRRDAWAAPESLLAWSGERAGGRWEFSEQGARPLPESTSVRELPLITRPAPAAPSAIEDILRGLRELDGVQSVTALSFTAYEPPKGGADRR